jgi:hypothetical protein
LEREKLRTSTAIGWRTQGLGRVRGKIGTEGDNYIGHYILALGRESSVYGHGLRALRFAAGERYINLNS